MSDLNDTKSNSDISQTDLENDVTNSRRDFLKKTGKFAIYTPPAMMLLMKPSYAKMNKSLVGRPKKEYGEYPKKKKVTKKRATKKRVAKKKVARNGNGKSW